MIVINLSNLVQILLLAQDFFYDSKGIIIVFPELLASLLLLYTFLILSSVECSHLPYFSTHICNSVLFPSAYFAMSFTTNKNLLRISVLGWQGCHNKVP